MLFYPWFPGGLKYDRQNGLWNPSNDSVFNQLQSFWAGDFPLVGDAGLELEPGCGREERNGGLGGRCRTRTCDLLGVSEAL